MRGAGVGGTREVIAALAGVDVGLWTVMRAPARRREGVVRADVKGDVLARLVTERADVGGAIGEGLSLRKRRWGRRGLFEDDRIVDTAGYAQGRLARDVATDHMGIVRRIEVVAGRTVNFPDRR